MALPDISQFLREGDALIIVPPFAGLDRPSLAAHLLQACAARAGASVRVLYASLLLGAEIGEINYEAVCYAASGALLGERFFAAAAYGLPPFGTDSGYQTFFDQPSEKLEGVVQVDLAELQRLEPGVAEWADEVASAIAARGYKVVGCTTTFEQTAASVALLARIKRARPDTVTIIGGANCDGEMAEGILSLGASVDYVFSGESEETFPDFMRRVLSGKRPRRRIVEGGACMNLDALPTPDFSEFYEQFAHLIPDSALAANELILLPYETSRGCWWGEKHHCTFCGLNAQTMAHREKSPERVVEELKLLLEKHPTRKVCFVDNIMPRSYFKTLLPRLAEEVPNLRGFYEEKANLSLDNVLALKSAGVTEIQPGIEALSTSLLKRMDKGVSARQNVALLRYARAAGVNLTWNLLYAFPGDRAEDYEQTLALVPLLRHLMPPGGLSHLSIDRFSPYFDYAERYRITNLRPMESYASVLPPHADVSKVAYHFVGDYESASREAGELIDRLAEEVNRWMKLWRTEEEALPALAVTPFGDEAFLLMDTRGLDGAEEIQFLSREQAAVALAGASLGEREEIEWALDARLVVELDSFFVPLATADPSLIREFEAERRPRARPALPVIQAAAASG
ncbi:MAG TPA: RiPP maturation radical SAM C-methyltransferase [Pyrinomonadaceae bacterium]|nr:RiPP maturation radical SAM C-methyltransferase [Pyrinomonadaceae bacterium]